jgi:hypothetical protein
MVTQYIQNNESKNIKNNHQKELLTFKNQIRRVKTKHDKPSSEIDESQIYQL